MIRTRASAHRSTHTPARGGVALRKLLAPTLALFLAAPGAAADPCPERGFLDPPAPPAPGALPRIGGWVWSSARVTEVVVRQRERVLAATTPELPRDDVAAEFPACRSGQPPGFSVTVPPAPDAAGLVVEARTADGRTLEIGTVNLDLAGPFGALENSGAIAQGAETSVHGWAISPFGELKVSVLAGDVELANGTAGGRRDDIAALYGAERSGFDLPLSFETLPRGRHALTVRLTDRDGRRTELRGPELINDRALGGLEDSGPIALDAPNVLRGWAITADGGGSVRIRAGDRDLGVFAADRVREDVGRRYPLWPHAGRSGFEAKLSFRDLPRGRYPLMVTFSDAAGEYLTLRGPSVHNDLPIGRVLQNRWRMVDPDPLELSAWVADEDGIATVELVTESGRALAPLDPDGAERPYSAALDATEGKLGEPEPPVATGRVYRTRFDTGSLPPGLHRLAVRATDNRGRSALLPGPLVLRRDAAEDSRAACAGEPFRLFFPGDTETFRWGFAALQELRDLAAGPCVEIGLRGRVEYLRTTFGKQADYRFDPDFPDALRLRPEGSITSTALNELLGLAARLDAPMLVTLDGGPWADARFAAPDIDIVDVLEQDELAVQWNQWGKAEPDDALGGLAGSYGSPQLARMMNLSPYNAAFRHYKQRNLQAAVRTIVEADAVAPGRFVAVNLDPDQYVNPWFYQAQWYDYSPQSLRQFREWLTHGGPYAPGAELAGSGHAPALDLGAINRLAGQHWRALEQVDPPRGRPDYADPWHQLWTAFKRHQVAQHYGDLARWAAEAGLDPARIYTSQTFIQADVAVDVQDRASGWTDEAGVSIAGAKPAAGHLGAILYGPASRNEGRPRSGESLFHDIRAADPDWAVVELHPATIEFPEMLPSHADAYATISRTLNFGARFISPMWGSEVADRFVYPQRFRSYDTFTGSSFEYQLLWWLRYRRDTPVGSLGFPFGNEAVASDDGWTASAAMSKERGEVRLAVAQPWLTLRSASFGTRQLAPGSRLEVRGTWRPGLRVFLDLQPPGSENGGATLALAESAGMLVGVTTPHESVTTDRIALRWLALDAAPIGAVRIDDIRLLAAPASDAAH